jgi:hypothetical protein
MQLVRLATTCCRIERERRKGNGAVALKMARSVGQFRRRRSPSGRLLLRRFLYQFDKVLPGSNCFRRVLLEVALDSGSSAESVCFGVDTGANPFSGHVWIESDTASPSLKTYDYVFKL